MPSAHAKTARKDWLFLAAAVLAGYGIATMVVRMLGVYAAHPIINLDGNIDWGYLNHGLDRVHSFRDTGRWWTGTWCGEVPFWRPVTSYVFWGMRLLWPEEYMLPREVVTVILHLCFVTLGGLLTWRLTRRRWLVILSIYLFAGFRVEPLSMVFGVPSGVEETISDPKNIPELLVGIPMLASLILLISKRWVGALIAAVIAVCCKETGFMIWPLAVTVLVWTHRDRLMSPDRARYLTDSIRRNWLPITVWIAVFGLMAAVHYAAVGIGYNCGTNRAWPWRAMNYFGGPVIASVVTRDFSPPLASVMLFITFLLTRRYSLLPRFLSILAVLAVAILIDAKLQRISLDVSIVRMLTYRLNLALLITFIIWLAIAWESRHDWQTISLGLAASFFAAIPSWMAAQVLEHARYQATFFMEIAVAAALLQNATAVSRIVNDAIVRRRKNLNQTE